MPMCEEGSLSKWSLQGVRANKWIKLKEAGRVHATNATWFSNMDRPCDSEPENAQHTAASSEPLEALPKGGATRTRWHTLLDVGLQSTHADPVGRGRNATREGKEKEKASLVCVNVIK